jgi:hypothetical protein
MPLTSYKLNKKSLQDSINLNLASSVSIEAPSNISENNHKRQRVESIEHNIPLQSTITITLPTENIDEQPRKKKTKTKTIEDQVTISPVIQSAPEPSVQPLRESIIEKEIDSEAPLSLPSTNGRIRELKSKTPAWKSQPPPAKGNSEGNNSPSSSHLITTSYRQITHSIRF